MAKTNSDDNNNKINQGGGGGFFGKLGGSVLVGLVQSFDYILEAIAYTIGLFWDGMARGVLSVWDAVSEMTTGIFTRSKTERWKRLIDYLSKGKAIDDATIADLNRLQNLSEPLEYITYLFTWVASIGVYIKTYLYVATADIRRKMNRDYEPENIDINSVMRAVFTAPEKMPEAKKILEFRRYLDQRHI